MGRTVRRVLLLALLLLALVLRLRGIENPLLDDQAWRQTDTAGMAVFMQDRLSDLPDVFSPRLSYDGIVPQKAELEFPLLPYLLAWTWHFTGRADIWGRLWAVAFSLLAVWGIYQLGKNIMNASIGLLAAGLYAVIPLGVYYGRVIMPEPVAQAVSIWALVVAAKPGKRKYIRVIGPGLLMALAILAKLPQLMLLPVAGCLIFGSNQKGYEGGRSRLGVLFSEGLLFLLVVLLPPVIYYFWVHTGSLGVNSFISGIYSVQIRGGNPIDWQTLVKNILLGFSRGLLVLVIMGVLRLFFAWRTMPRLGTALLVWLGIAIFYIILICARIPLDYYLLPVLPLAAILGALAFDWFEDIPRFVTGVVVMGLLVVNVTTVYKAKYEYQQAYAVQAAWLRENTPPESVLVLSDDPPMTFYYAQRTGFRLIGTDDRLALTQLHQIEQQIIAEQLQKTTAVYLVRSPQSVRGTAFWQVIKTNYPEIIPGVFLLKKEVPD